MRIEAAFVTSATGAAELPGGGPPEIALVGRSNVGKSSLINALTRQRIARASAAPGKTRLANVYRVARGNARPVYLVDLPGYGYAPRQARGALSPPKGARGGGESARGFDALTRGYFERTGQAGRAGQAGQAGNTLPAWPAQPGPPAPIRAILLVDARHPGLDSDRAAWQWLKHTVSAAAIVATKIDKLPRGQRIRAVRELESVFEDSVLPVSAVTGEGLDELWNLIDRLLNSPNPQPRRNRNSRPQKATAARLPKK